MLALLLAALCTPTPSPQEPGAPGSSALPAPLDYPRERLVVVDRDPNQYLGHPSTVLLGDGRSLLVAYPKGHGKGAIVLRRSSDGGATWSAPLATPKSWETSQETPTLFRVQAGAGKHRLLLFSGLAPIRMARSEDEGASWSELAPIGEFGGIVAMSSLVEFAPGTLTAFFHDDGRFLGERFAPGDGVRFHVFATDSADGGLTWGAPRVVAARADADLCEPGAVTSPDGKELALLLRENRRQHRSFLTTSLDGGKSWSAPRELALELTGDRHVARYAPDGRLAIVLRDMAEGSTTRGDWVLWLGPYGDLAAGKPGDLRVRLADNRHPWDSSYSGLELLPDGRFVATTYGHWDEGAPPFLVCARFTLAELEALGAR
ncbi:MAG: exo-alpha-sialidase [Planctomycetes bacterium]|nr:exo-alpha-sialidase [Planctomycetota bacterium]